MALMTSVRCTPQRHACAPVTCMPRLRAHLPTTYPSYTEHTAQHEGASLYA